MAGAIVLTEEEGNIPYEDLVGDLFLSDAQVWIPFLGAGVSISAMIRTEQTSARQQDPRISKALECLRETGPDGTLTQFDDETIFFLQSAMEMALELERLDQRPASGASLFNELRQRQFPPSSGELTEVFRAGVPPFEPIAENLIKRLGYPENDPAARQRILRLLRGLAGIASVSSPSLSGMSAYFELLNSRTDLLRKIAHIFENKDGFTRTHEVIARAAAHHLKKNESHFLIITTNYDCLMEKALEAREDRPPYVVLSANKNDFQVRARFGNMPEEMRARFADINKARVPNSYILNLPEPLGDESEPPIKHLAVIYKLHGCIHDVLQCPNVQQHGEDDSKTCIHDGIVLSDEDYIASIARLAHNDGVIPSAVADLMRRKPILFLGYSLSDWNVRGFLKVLRHKGAGTGGGRDAKPDFAVVRRLNTLDRGFFIQNNVTVLKTELNTFSPTLQNKASINGIPP